LVVVGLIVVVVVVVVVGVVALDVIVLLAVAGYQLLSQCWGILQSL
jgi:hypothetical protein